MTEKVNERQIGTGEVLPTPVAVVSREIPWQLVWAAATAYFLGVVRVQEAIIKALIDNGLTEKQVEDVMAPVAASAKKTALWTCSILGVVGFAFTRVDWHALRVAAAFMIAFSVWLAVKHLSVARRKEDMGVKGVVGLLWKRARGE